MSESNPESSRAELTAVEQSLQQLTPSAGGIDRDTLLFRAGQAAAPRSWLWPTATALSTGVALLLAVLLAHQPAPGVIERTVYVPVPTPPAVPDREPPAASDSVPTEAVSEDDLPRHRRLQEHLLRWGLDGLGQPAPADIPSRPKPHPYLFSGELSP